MVRIDQIDKFPIAMIYFFPAQIQQSLKRETLDSVRGHYAAVHDRGAQRRFRDAPVPREESHHGACERVARAGRIDDLLKWICRHREHSFLAELKHAIFAALDQNGAWTHLQDRASRLYQVVFAGKDARFAVAAKQYLDSLEHFHQAGPRLLDPIIEQIRNDDFGTVYLLQYVFLQGGIVRRKVQIVRATLIRQQFGREIFQYVERKRDGVAHVQVFVITPVPACRFALALDDSTHVDIPFGEQPHIFGPEIRTDHRDDTDRREKSRRNRKVAGAATQDFLDFSVGRFDRVVGQKPDRNNAHLYRILIVPDFERSKDTCLPTAANRRSSAAVSRRDR